MDRQKALHQYILDHIDEEDPVLTELDRETNLKVLGARMISGHLQGQVLTMLAKMIRPKTVLELGTFTGYSAICLAKGLPDDGKLITIEMDDELETLARKYFGKAGVSHLIEQKIGAATDLIPSLDQSFDLVFIDADKREYVDYYQLLIDKMQSGAYLIADNTLWSGKVLGKPRHDDRQTIGIQEFNKLVKNDDRVEKVILPLRDGMTVIRKK
ncbi:O-methyltransferase [Draconibacterium halophilum]|uniref:O-methyltransferase n=1 Tax=Draconibacterium halophilum TaxID=2706887 RepID=A0A6C0RGJ2_9BACT|nr:O-methyltransferase [Draconibacterium halophilum]QIA09634.1 O-methyltransferase [Draconibacterium halophilum]